MWVSLGTRNSHLSNKVVEDEVSLVGSDQALLQPKQQTRSNYNGVSKLTDWYLCATQNNHDMLAKGDLFVGALRNGNIHPPGYLGSPIPMEYVIVIKVLDLSELVIDGV